MRRAAIAVVTILLAAFIITAGVPAAPAHALCTSSIDPKCAGANLPILIEAGVVTGSKGTSIVHPTATAVGGATSQTSIVAGGLFGGAFISMVTSLAQQASLPFMGFNGSKDQVLKTNPEFVFPENQETCLLGSTAEAAALLIGRCTTFPVTMAASNDVLRYMAKVDVSYGTPNSGNYVTSASWTVTRAGTTGDSGNGPLRVSGYCKNLASGVVSVRGTGYDRTSAIAVGSSWGPYSTTCLAGEIFSGVVARFYDAIPSTTGYQFLMVDSPFRDIGATKDMAGTIRTSITCKPTVGAQYPKVVSAPFDIKLGDDLPIPDASCNDPDMMIIYRVDWQPTNSQEWIPIVAPTSPPAIVQQLPIDYPDCFGLGMGCTMELFQKGAGGDLLDCRKGVACPQWTSNPSNYVCKYGNYVVSMDMCSAFRAAATGPVPNTRPDNTPYSPTSPPPSTANPSNPLKDTTGTTVPDPAIVLPPAWVDTEGSSAECWPTGWGVLNPLSWVYMPMKCALEWAFVPRVDIVTSQIAGLNDAIDMALFGDLVALQDAFVDPFRIASTACQGPAFRLDLSNMTGGGMVQTYYPLSACTAPMDTVAFFFRNVTSGVVFLGAGLATLRYFASIVGFVGFGNNAASAGSKVRFKDAG